MIRSVYSNEHGGLCSVGAVTDSPQLDSEDITVKLRGVSHCFDPLVPKAGIPCRQGDGMGGPSMGGSGGSIATVPVDGRPPSKFNFISGLRIFYSEHRLTVVKLKKREPLRKRFPPGKHFMGSLFTAKAVINAKSALSREGHAMLPVKEP